MSGWSDRVDFSELGPGWVRLSKRRPEAQVSSNGGRMVDHMYVAPSGAKFRSIKSAQEYLANAPFAEFHQPKPAEPPPGKAKAAAAAKAKKPAKPKSAAAIAKAEAAREAAKTAAEAARLHALNADTTEAVCFECGSGEEVLGNEILLCDGAGCHAAYHLRCLERPLFAVPEGDWLCPACEPPAPPPAKLTSPAGVHRQLQPERQAVGGCELMRWARTETANAAQRHPVARDPPAPAPLAELCGKACFYTTEASGGESPPQMQPEPNKPTGAHQFPSELTRAAARRTLAL